LSALSAMMTTVMVPGLLACSGSKERSRARVSGRWNPTVLRTHSSLGDNTQVGFVSNDQK
jgi:hypothetical protein